jgi:A/G-specific adenine glycosylase
LAGLYELPNTEGHLGENDVTAFVRSLGFEPLQIARIEDAKHVFSHIEWHMIAYTVRISSEFDGFHATSGYTLVSNEELHKTYAIPSAFSAYTKYL